MKLRRRFAVELILLTNPRRQNREATMSASSSKRFAEAVFNGAHPLCAFFHNKDEAFRRLSPFILDGLIAGEKAIHVINVNLREAYRRRMTEIGVDAEAAVRSGQLEVISWPV